MFLFCGYTVTCCFLSNALAFTAVLSGLRAYFIVFRSWRHEQFCDCPLQRSPRCREEGAHSACRHTARYVGRQLSSELAARSVLLISTACLDFTNRSEIIPYTCRVFAFQVAKLPYEPDLDRR